MKPSLTPGQFEMLSVFCNDISKGLMLGVFIGQGFLGGLTGVGRLAVSLSWITASLFLLYFALAFKREAEI